MVPCEGVGLEFLECLSNNVPNVEPVNCTDLEEVFVGFGFCLETVCSVDCLSFSDEFTDLILESDPGNECGIEVSDICTKNPETTAAKKAVLSLLVLCFTALAVTVFYLQKKKRQLELLA